MARPLAAALMWEFGVGARDKALLFPLTPQRFRSDFHATLHHMGLKDKPPHDLRHTGAAVDIFHQFRSVEGVRHRG